MKMMKVEIEFVVFATGDVITTSTITGDDTLVKVIYLTPTSAKFFNKMVPSGSPKLLTGVSNAFIGYSGQIIDINEDEDDPLYRYSIAGTADVLTPEQQKALYTVSEGNTKEYNAVLSWLTAHRM